MASRNILPRLLTVGLGLALLFGSSLAQAFINNPNYRSGAFDYGVWANSGDIRIQSPRRCVMSTDGVNNSSGNPTNYTVTATMTTGDGVFQLTQVGGDGIGQEAIPMTLQYQWNDDVTSTTEALGYGVASNPHLGGIKVGSVVCSINGVRVNNGRLVILINEADLLAAENGVYEGYLSITHTGGVGMGQSRTRNNVKVSLQKASTAIQIRKLGTVNLGTWNGNSAFIDDREAYCVYSSTGAYRITASSTTEGSGGAGTFGIEHSVLAGRKIDYDLFLDDDRNAENGGLAITNGGTLTGFTGTTSSNCPGNNAALYVKTTSDLSMARAGAYVSELTLTVEPE